MLRSLFRLTQRHGGRAFLLVLHAVTVTALSGCYVYEPLATPEPRIGSSVSVELTDHGSLALAPSIGPGIEVLRGDVVDRQDTSVTLAVSSVTDHRGEVTSWNGERVRLQRSAVRHFNEKRFSRSRSALVGAAVVAGSILAWDVFEEGIRGGSLSGGSGEPEPQ
jgi:hypothetical protein